MSPVLHCPRIPVRAPAFEQYVWWLRRGKWVRLNARSSNAFEDRRTKKPPQSGGVGHSRGALAGRPRRAPGQRKMAWVSITSTYQCRGHWTAVAGQSRPRRFCLDASRRRRFIAYFLTHAFLASSHFMSLAFSQSALVFGASAANAGAATASRRLVMMAVLTILPDMYLPSPSM